MTTLLDAAGLILVAAGAGAGAGVLIGWSGMAVSGVVLLAGSWWSQRQADAS